MRMFGWMKDKTRNDRIRNEDIRDNFTLIEDKMRENSLESYSYKYIRKKTGCSKEK